jgi:multicomponent Na+:H+ antiporter subunit G
MTTANWVSVAFLLAGAFFLLVSSLGILRLPDFFTRSHAVGKSETLGSLFFLLGLAIYNGFELESAKLLLILFFIAVTNPSGIHVLSRAALRKGLEIWVHPQDRAEARDRLTESVPSAKPGEAPTGLEIPESPPASTGKGSS